MSASDHRVKFQDNFQHKQLENRGKNSNKSKQKTKSKHWITESTGLWSQKVGKSVMWEIKLPRDILWTTAQRQGPQTDHSNISELRK